MRQVRLYGKNRKRLRHRRCYWTDIAAWKAERLKKTGNAVTTVNVTSRSKDWGRELSPILLGPVDTYIEDGKMLRAVNVEVAWQYSKIYSHGWVDGTLVPLCFQDKDGKPNNAWFAWRDKAWTNPAFVAGHRKFKANKHLVRRAYPKGSTIAAWYWKGKVLDAVTARREIYATLYSKAVQASAAYKLLRALYASGDVAIFDLDGYDFDALGLTPEDKRYNGSRRGRVKGRTTARVASVKSIVHLDSTSALHSEHQELSKRIHSQSRREITVSIDPPELLHFPSLGKGIMLDERGSEISGETHLRHLDRLRQDRSYYVTQETRKNGATYERKLRTTGVHQLAVPYYPVYSMTFARLDNQGLPVRDLVLDHTRKLGKEFERLTGYELLASQIHPNEGVLHPHLCYATVDHEHRLLHSLNGRGRRGLRFLGPACIGTLRLVENGIWREEDAEMARRFLSGSVRNGQQGSAPVTVKR